MQSDPEDLMRLAEAAGLTGREREADDLLARAYQGFVTRGEAPAAARCAFWLGMRLQTADERIRGAGWIARARRLLDEAQVECVEQGYVMVPLARQMLEEGDARSAMTTFGEALRIGQRYGEADLIGLARLGLGILQVHGRSAAEGLAYLDEMMIAVEGGEVSPLVTGIMYCAVIDTCHQVYDLRRAQDWTEALTRWCAAHPDVVPFQGQCQVNRAHILRIHGAWPAAMDIAQSVVLTGDRMSTARAIGPAFYQTAELHRLRGEFDRAEEAYRAASRWNFVPEPGSAQLRLAQGHPEAAAATIMRALEEVGSRSTRVGLLSAGIDIFLANGQVPEARSAADELARLGDELDAPFVRGCAQHAIGAVRLADGDARGALNALREACTYWQQLDAPYEAARSRELIGLGCRLLGDEDRARLELDAARWTYHHLGASPDQMRVDRALRRTVVSAPGGLTERELEVLRLLASGRSNRAIASELVLSDRTVARHVSNIFTKLGLSSRAAATAYAYEHALV